ncbi:MAG: RNA polymerase sigma factor [Gemmatimonadota bacterium]
MGSTSERDHGESTCRSLEALCDLRPGLYRFSYAALGNREDAEDAVQETLLQALAVLRSAESRAVDLPAYVFGIARHVISDLHARRYRTGDVLGSRRISSNGRGNGNGFRGGSNSHERATALDAAIAYQRSRTIERALRQLTPPQRAVIRACFWDGDTCATFARRRSIPPARVRKTKSRALARLRGSLGSGAWLAVMTLPI